MRRADTGGSIEVRCRGAGRGQRGATVLVVLILLSVMLLGGLALARMTGAGTLVAGNIASKERALQASEVGINTAFAAIAAAGFDDEPDDPGNWYYAKFHPLDGNGLPDGVDLENGASVALGAYTVHYVVERMCTHDVVTDEELQCLLRHADDDGLKCPSGPGSLCSEIPPPAARQFRITVQVTGPRGTRTLVQSLVTRGA